LSINHSSSTYDATTSTVGIIALQHSGTTLGILRLQFPISSKVCQITIFVDSCAHQR
jgi:hypothetical protein